MEMNTKGLQHWMLSLDAFDTASPYDIQASMYGAGPCLAVVVTILEEADARCEVRQTYVITQGLLSGSGNELFKVWRRNPDSTQQYTRVNEAPLSSMHTALSEAACDAEALFFEAEQARTIEEWVNRTARKEYGSW